MPVDVNGDGSVIRFSADEFRAWFTSVPKDALGRRDDEGFLMIDVENRVYIAGYDALRNNEERGPDDVVLILRPELHPNWSSHPVSFPPMREPG